VALWTGACQCAIAADRHGDSESESTGQIVAGTVTVPGGTVTSDSEVTVTGVTQQAPAVALKSQVTVASMVPVLRLRVPVTGPGTGIQPGIGVSESRLGLGRAHRDGDRAAAA
jgi:hypothetical protein